jgi:tetratricopeptide (TPR) repeat protein
MAQTHAKWKSFPHENSAFLYEGAALKKHWARLHRCDCEPFPDPACLKKLIEAHPAIKPSSPIADIATRLQDAWRAFHRGDFYDALTSGLSIGPPGYNVANRAANIYATYLEPDKGRRLEIFQDVLRRAEELHGLVPDLVNGWYYGSQALGRYAQGISVARAIGEGLAGKLKSGLERALKLEPNHSDAHIALGAYHANVVSKMGALAGRLTFGASKEAAAEHFEKAVKLNPDSAIAKIEFANGLAMLFGKSRLADAMRLYDEAAGIEPADAMEKLDVELAKAEIED